MSPVPAPCTPGSEAFAGDGVFPLIRLGQRSHAPSIATVTYDINPCMSAKCSGAAAEMVASCVATCPTQP